MSGFGRNVIPRRAHKERAQPAGRVARHGLLEKKKDWKLRAKNYHKKQANLKILREKAAFRNPDEFYFGMISSKGTKRGRERRVQDAKDAIPIEQRTKDERLLAETTDQGYVSVKSGLEKGKLETLKKSLHFLDAAQATKRTHRIFVDTEEDMRQFSERKHVRALKRDMQTGGQVQSEDIVSSSQSEATGASVLSWKSIRQNRRAYREFEQRLDRGRKLNTVLDDMRLEKNLLQKGARFRVRKSDPETGTPTVFRWKQVRKR